MITSKNNLSIVNLTTVDKKIPILDCIRIESDGTTVAGNGKSFMVVSPVSDEIQKKLVFYNEFKEDSLPVNITSTSTKKMMQSITSNKDYNGMLEHAVITSKEEGKVEFVLYDGAQHHFIEGKVNPMPYAPYKKLYQRALSNKKEIQVVVNAKRLLPLIETMLKVSQDASDFSPMFIEFTDEKDIIIRMMNPKTGQRCIGLMWSYKGNEAKWLEPDQWEEELKNGTDETDGTVVTNVNDNNRSVVRIDDSNRIVRRTIGAKKRGNPSLARIIDAMCPECGKFHLASDGTSEWCSCKSGCNFYRRVK